MKRRVVIIVLALILAAVGTSGVLSYVKKASARAVAGLQPVSVLVAQKKIPAGTIVATAVREGLLASEKLPAATVPVNSLSSVPTSLDSLTFSADVAPGQLLLRPMLIQATQLTSGMAIPSGSMAVTINFCLSEAVAGAVHAGSEVAVFDTIGSGGLSAQPGCSGSHGQITGSVRTRMVLPRLLVLAVGAATGGTAASATTGAASGSSSSLAGGGSGTLVTLAVSQANAERLIQLTEAGMPYLGLLSPQSQTTADMGNLLNIPAKAGPSPAPSPALTFPVVTPSAVPTQPVPSSAPSASPSPSPSPSKQKSKKGK